MEGNTASAEQPDYLTVEEAARRFRVSAPTIYRRCADGTLPHIRIGAAGPIRIALAQLERFSDPSVSDDGLPAGSSFEPAQSPSERRGTQTMRGQSNPQAHTGQ